METHFHLPFTSSQTDDDQLLFSLIENLYSADDGNTLFKIFTL